MLVNDRRDLLATHLCNVALLGALALGISGCTGLPAAPAPQPEVVESSPAPTPSQDGSQEGPSTCEVAIEQGLAATISTQIDALSASDFATAYSMASPLFQSSFSQAAFENVITDGYAFLLESPRFVLSDCIHLESMAQAQTRVTVTTPAGEIFVLTYQMSEQPAGWRIDGASLSGAGSSTT